MAEPSRQYLFTEAQIRTAFVMAGIGMIVVIVGILVLATSQPQGRFQPADTSEFEATLAAATEDLEGFERVGESRARIDIDTAMELVVERGVDLRLVSIESDAAPETAEDGDTPAGDDSPSAQAALPDGEAVYANCSGCHQATGAGIPGAFPPLDGHAADLVLAEGGRDYLIQVILRGIQGAIEVQGASYNGVMPAWPQLSDAEVAAVLNYSITAWSNGDRTADVEPYSAEEVAALRDVDPGDLLDVRNGLDLP